MSQFPRQFFGRSIDVGLQAIVIGEPVKVGGLGGDVNKIQDPPTPVRGTLHPDQVHYPGAVVERIRLREWINRDIALVDVIYRRQLTGYAGGARPGSRVEVGAIGMEIPTYESFVSSSGTTHYYQNPYAFPRSTIRRTETRFLSSPPFNAIQDAVSASVGRWFVIGGQPMIFMGANVTFDGISYTRVEYQFKTNAAIAAVPIGNRTAIAIPACPQLWGYIPRDDRTPPVVFVAPETDLANVGVAGDLPGL